MLFQRPGECRSFIPRDYSRQHTELAEKRMDKKDNNKDLNE